MRGRRRLLAALSLLLLPGCALFQDGPARGPEGARPGGARPEEAPAPLPVQKAGEDVIVAAWAEPARLPPAGGQSQVIVRVQKRGGVPYPGVQVRLKSAPGTLFSAGRILMSDATGRTRDRLSARKTSWITVNAGGTVYRFRVPVGATAEE